MASMTEHRGVGPIRSAPSVRIKLEDGNPRQMGPYSIPGRAVCGKDRVGPMSCSSLAMTPPPTPPSHSWKLEFFLATC